MSKSKFWLPTIVRVNFSDPNGSRSRTAANIVVRVLVPLAVGIALGSWTGGTGLGWWFGPLEVNNAVSVALPSASLLVGAMFGAFVFLTNLRVKLEESDRYAYRHELQRRVGAAAAACLYTASASIGFAGLVALVGSVPALRSVAIAPAVVGLIAAYAFHLGIILTGVLGKLIGIYLEMFRSDFDPTVEVPVGGEEHNQPAIIMLEPRRSNHGRKGR